MSNDPFTRTVDTNALCQEIAEVLAGFDGDTIAAIANKVLSDKVVYNGYGKFTVEDADAVGLRKNG